MVVLVEVVATVVTVLAPPYLMVTVGDDPEEEKVVGVGLMRCIVHRGPVTGSEVMVKMEMVPCTRMSPGVRIHHTEVILCS